MPQPTSPAAVVKDDGTVRLLDTDRPLTVTVPGEPDPLPIMYPRRMAGLTLTHDDLARLVDTVLWSRGADTVGAGR